MRPSVFNPGLMADFKRTPAVGDSITFTQDFTDDLKEIEAVHEGFGQACQNIDKHKELVELLPEPAGGYRANLITFCIRCHTLGADKRPDFRQMLSVEKAYLGINQMSFAAGRQTGKSGQTQDNVRAFLGNWLNYIEQAVSKGA